MTTVLAADIGGTSCRLGLFRCPARGCLELVENTQVPTAKVHRTPDLQSAAVAAFGKDRIAGVSAVACDVAGAVADGRVRLSNADLELEEDEGSRLFGGRPFRLLNDFGALALAMATATGRGAQLVCGEDVPDAGHLVRAVVGAGTGFGCAALLPVPGGHPLVMASEGGHMAFGFCSEEEEAFAAFVRRRRGIRIVSTEEVLAGRGLEALCAFLTGRELAAAEVAAEYLGSETPVLELYSRFYGRACRDWILATMCAGGLWIAGGIAMKNPLAVQSRFFREEISQGVHAAFVGRVPVRLFPDEACCLWGAARCAASLAG